MVTSLIVLAWVEGWGCCWGLKIELSIHLMRLYSVSVVFTRQKALRFVAMKKS